MLIPVNLKIWITGAYLGKYKLTELTQEDSKPRWIDNHRRNFLQ